MTMTPDIIIQIPSSLRGSLSREDTARLMCHALGTLARSDTLAPSMLLYALDDGAEKKLFLPSVAAVKEARKLDEDLYIRLEFHVGE